MATTSTPPTSTLTPHLLSLLETTSQITTLPFRPPSKFVNAILHSTDIVSLIRDTEAHERALFTAVSENPASFSASTSIGGGGGGGGIGVGGGGAGGVGGLGPGYAGVKRNTAVGAYLGGEMAEKLRRGTVGGVQGVDVELLLKGAERLLKVYQIPNAQNRVSKLRQQYESLKESIEHYSAQVDEQTRELEALHEGVGIVDVKMEDAETGEEEEITMAMVEEEERALKELELKKLNLEMDIKKYERYLSGA